MNSNLKSILKVFKDLEKYNKITRDDYMDEDKVDLEKLAKTLKMLEEDKNVTLILSNKTIAYIKYLYKIYKL